MSRMDSGIGGNASVVGAFDAKTHLANLLERVARGEVITITKHGVPVARLAPLEDPKKPRDPAALLAEFRAFRKRHPLPPTVTARDLINEGRKW